jgi:hypothetical protein
MGTTPCQTSKDRIDPCLRPASGTFPPVHKPGDGRPVGSLKPDRGLPGLYAHYERMMARPAVQRTIADEAAVGYELPA